MPNGLNVSPVTGYEYLTFYNNRLSEDASRPAKPAGTQAFSWRFVSGLADEFPGLADDGDIDEGRSGTDPGAVGHRHAAEVEIAHRFEAGDQALPRRLRSGALQALDQNLGGDEAL